MDPARSESDRPGNPLLATKLYAPPVRPGLVARPRLLRRLDGGLEGRLILVSAPAGYGKTTLLSEWIHRRGRVVPPAGGIDGITPLKEHTGGITADKAPAPLRFAWLSLDAGDNDPARFVGYLVAALQTALTAVPPAIEHEVGEAAQALLQSPQLPPLEAVLSLLINELCTLPDQTVIVLDDYYLVDAPEIHRAVTFLLDHLPPAAVGPLAGVHLVIATRTDPPLPLARWRSRGELVEVRATHLRFTPGEAAAFLNEMMGLGLSAADVEAIAARTEGWAAGLRLAALSMQDRADVGGFVSAFTGSHHYIADYLVEEVLQRQDETVRSFLLQTSILDRLSGPLCDALTERNDGQPTLEALERANLFLVPLDDKRRWYRYHRLFAELLRSRRRLIDPERVPGLHLRAARWYQENGFAAEAIHHALAAGDRETAAQIVEQNAMPMVMRGELISLLNWIDAVGDLLCDRPWLAVYRAWAFTFSGRLDRVEPALLEAERCLSSLDPEQEYGQVQGSIAAIRAYGSAVQGDMPRALNLAQQALDLLPQSNPSIRGVVAFVLGGARRFMGDFVGASRAFAEAGRAGQATGNPQLAVSAICSLGDLLIGEGRLRQAAETYREALSSVTRPDGRRLPVAARAYVGLGGLYYEWNDLGTAAQHARQCVELCQQWSNPDALAVAHVVLAHVRQARGDLEGALEAAREAQRLARARTLHPGSAGRVEALYVRLWLAQGDLDAAARWVQENGLTIDDEIHPMRELENLAFGHVLLALGRLDESLYLCARLLRAAKAAGRMGRAIPLLVLRALALQAKRDVPQAALALERALALAQPEGYVRVFLDEGEAMVKLLRQVRQQASAPHLVQQYAAQLLAELDSGLSAAPVHPQPLIEPLTERELQVLHVLSGGKSNQEIADELVIAVGTVKKHLNTIFGKLNVTSRTECVVRARELRLVE